MPYRIAGTLAGTLIFSSCRTAPDAAKVAAFHVLPDRRHPCRHSSSFLPAARFQMQPGWRSSMPYRIAGTLAGTLHLFFPPHVSRCRQVGGVPCLTGSPAPLPALFIFSSCRTFPDAARLAAFHALPDRRHPCRHSSSFLPAARFPMSPRWRRSVRASYGNMPCGIKEFPTDLCQTSITYCQGKSNESGNYLMVF